MRAAWIAVVLLAAGFAAGLYISDRLGAGEPDASPPATTVAAAPAETTPPPAPDPDPEQPEPAEPRPAFSVAPLPRAVRARLREGGFWRPGCPVPLSGLRLLTVSYHGFDGQMHTGELVVNARAARPLKGVFRRLHRMRFPIRNIGFDLFYGRPGQRAPDGDVTASFECRESVPSPCTGGTASGNWSNHAYGLAVDVNPTENPYIGCGQSRDPATKPFRDRSRHRRGMIDARVVEAFRSIGWGWGGAWSGDTKDYMHFSVNGH